MSADGDSYWCALPAIATGAVALPGRLHVSRNGRFLVKEDGSMELPAVFHALRVDRALPVVVQVVASEYERSS